MSFALRRRMVAAAAALLAMPPRSALAQATLPRVGIVFNTASLDSVQGTRPDAVFMRGFLAGLGELGFVEGKTVRIERWTAAGQLDRLEGIVRELASLPVDVIVVSGEVATLAARKATDTVPIVAVMATPVELGIVASLARPGGNVTGVVPTFGRELSVKRLELLRELVPGARRVAYLGLATSGEIPDAVRVAASAMGVALVFVDARLPRIADGLAQLERERVDALLVPPLTPLYPHVEAIAASAARLRLPDVYGSEEAVDAGGLASYGNDTHDAWRRCGRYAARVLKGEKPATMPVEQMDRYRLVVNRKRAQALGIPIPAAVEQRADRID
jgi:putative ABC transport system substrate-binding protein